MNYDDGTGMRRLSEAERIKLCLTEETANDPTPACIFQGQAMEAATSRALAERTRRAELFDPDICGELAEA